MTSLETPASGRARPRRHDDVRRLQGRDLIGSDLVVAIDAHVHRRIQLAQPLHEVVGERIVVVDEKNHNHWFAACGLALAER